MVERFSFVLTNRTRCRSTCGYDVYTELKWICWPSKNEVIDQGIQIDGIDTTVCAKL